MSYCRPRLEFTETELALLAAQDVVAVLVALLGGKLAGPVLAGRPPAKFHVLAVERVDAVPESLALDAVAEKVDRRWLGAGIEHDVDDLLLGASQQREFVAFDDDLQLLQDGLVRFLAANLGRDDSPGSL